MTNGRFPQLNTEGARVRTRPESLCVEMLNGVLVDNAVVQEFDWPDGIADEGGWIKVSGFSRLILYAKTGAAGAYALQGRQGPNDVDVVGIGTNTTLAATKTAVFDEDVSLYHSVRVLARSTSGAASTQNLWLIMR